MGGLGGRAVGSISFTGAQLHHYRAQYMQGMSLRHRLWPGRHRYQTMGVGDRHRAASSLFYVFRAVGSACITLALCSASLLHQDVDSFIQRTANAAAVPVFTLAQRTAPLPRLSWRDAYALSNHTRDSGLTSHEIYGAPRCPGAGAYSAATTRRRERGMPLYGVRGIQRQRSSRVRKITLLRLWTAA